MEYEHIFVNKGPCQLIFRHVERKPRGLSR